MGYNSFIKKLQSGPLYFMNSYEDAVIHSNGKGSYLIRYKNGTEVKADHTSEIIREAFLEHKEITEEEFNNHAIK
jgi:hypothetical protein